MAVSYKKMFKLMIDHDMKRKDLKEKTGLSYGTIANLKKAKMCRWKYWKKSVRSSSVSLAILRKLCSTSESVF